MGAGRVEAVFVAAEPKAPLVAVERVRAVPGRGLEGDRYWAGTGTWWKPEKAGQEVTLVAGEVLDDLAARGVDLTGGRSRRNVVTRGVDLDALVGRRFRMGGVELVGVRACPPCDHLDQLTGLDAREALRGCGGLRADVAAGGSVAAGDEVRLLG